MPSPLSRHALRAAAPLLALLAVAGPASAQAPMGTPTPGHPVDRFADRVPIGTQGYVVGQAPTQAANTPDAQATNNESGPLLNGSLSRSSDGGRVVSSPDVNQRTRLAGYDVRIRPDLTATPLATLDGTEGGGADVRDVAVSALGCRDQLPGRIDVCLVSQITNVYENPDGTGFVSGAPIDPLPGSPALKAGTNVSVVGVDGLGGTDGRGLALGYVDPSGDAWVQYLQVTGGRAYPTKNSETATITRFGAPVKVHDADDTDVSGGALGAATNIDLAAGDLDGDGDQEVAAAVDGSQPGGGQIRGFVRAAVVDVVAGAPKLMSQVAEDFGGAAPRPYLRAASTRRNHATILASRVPATFGANAKPARDVLAVLSDLGEVGASPSQDPDAFLEGLTYTGGATPALTARRADQVFLSNQGGKDLQAVVARDVNHDATQELYVASSFKDPMFANLTVVQVKQGVTGAITYAASAFTSVGIGGDGLAIAAADTRNMPGANGCPVTPCQAFLPPASSSGASQGDDLLYATGANDGVDPPQLRLHYARLNPASSDTQNLGFQASQRVVTSGQPNDVGGDQPRSAGGPPLLATGTFGQRFEIGTPQLRQRDRIEPLVLLNSPPAHLDVIKDKLYDINTCHFVDFQAGECEFFTQFSDQQTTTKTVSTSTKEDYAFSTTVTASAGVDTARFKASLTASVTASIGGTTIKGNTTTNTTQVDVNVKAQDDDQLHIVNKHYDILEYPVYAAGAAAPLTYFAAVTPAVVSHRWVSANGPFAKDFVPQHETGNILSYPREPTPTYVKGIDDRPNYGTFGNTEFEVTRTSDNTYGVTTDTLTQDNVDTTFKAGFDASVKAEASGQIGPVAVSGSLEVAGSYAKEDFNTTTNSVGSNLSILSRLGRITAGVGRAGFLVRPFAYFTGPPSENAESGALVIDYAVTPDQGDDTDTFWQAQYGKRPDLGPNLVNYLDPERGIVAATEAARRQSKDISFTPGTCAKEATPTDQRFPQAGDPVCLRMQVENYSLKDRLGSVPVTFYLGDPAYGGKEIGSTSVPNVYARGTLNQKATAVASVDWTVPASLNGRVARVFAVADPAGPGATGVVPEVHEDDNKGWMPLTVYAKSDPIASGVFVSAVDAETDEDTGKLRVSFDVPTQQRVGVDYDVYAYPFDETGAATGTGTRLGTIGAGKPGDTLDGTFGANPLGAGTAYVVAVFPQDRGSELPVSFPSEPVGLTQGTPAAPQGVTATAGDGSAQVQWSAPRSDGGSPVTGYVVRVLDASGTQLQTTSVDAGTLRFTATGLTNGVPVRFEVTAINDRGSGAAAQSDLVTPTGAATQPVRVTAEAQAGGSAVVRWDPPENNGGNAVTSYTVLTSPGTGSVSAPASARQATVTGLTPGSTYRFRVVAQTNRGASAASAESDPIVAYAVPGAPQAVGLEPGVGKVLVRWSPAADNGRPVTTYRVTLSPSGIERTYGPDTRTAEITGLQGGTTYRASVVAENVAGAGPAGTATGATPGTAAQPASPPTAVGAEPGDAAATVSWTAPEKDGGAPITGYRVRSVPGDVRTTVGADARTATVGGLRNGTAYAFVVEAETAAGTGEDSQPSNGVIPRTRPGVPGDLAATAGDASAVVRWSPPASNGGMPITSYVVVTEPGGARTTVGGDQTQATILGLANGTAYTFRVQARSDGGLSDPSDPTPAVTPQASLPAAGAPGGAGGAGGTGIGASGGAGGSGTGGGGGSGGTGGAGGSGIGANGGTGGTAIGAAGGTGGTGGAGGNAAPTVVTAPDGTVYAVPGAVITFPVSISGEMLCRVDGMAAVACTSPYPLAGLAPGVHTIVISAVDGSVAPRTVKLVIDGRPPTASIDRLASYTSLSSIRPQLRVRDLDSGVSRVEVRTRRAKRTGRFGAYVVRTVTAGATRTEVAMAPGTTSCTSVRAIDVLGNASAWSPERCIARAMTPVELQKGQSGAKAYTTTGSRRSVSLAVGRTSRVVVVTGSRTSPVTVSLGRYRKTLSGRALAHGSAVFELPGSLQGTLRVSSASAPIAKVAVQRRP